MRPVPKVVPVKYIIGIPMTSLHQYRPHEPITAIQVRRNLHHRCTMWLGGDKSRYDIQEVYQAPRLKVTIPEQFASGRSCTEPQNRMADPRSYDKSKWKSRGGKTD